MTRIQALQDADRVGMSVAEQPCPATRRYAAGIFPRAVGTTAFHDEDGWATPPVAAPEP